MMFMQYGNEWSIHKFSITKPYFEKIVKNNSTQDFHKIVYDEILYLDQNKLLPPFFQNRTSVRHVSIGRISRKFQFLLNFTSVNILPRYCCALNIFATPELYRVVNMSFIRNLRKGFNRMQDNLNQTFRKRLYDPDLNINYII